MKKKYPLFKMLIAAGLTVMCSSFFTSSTKPLKNTATNFRNDTTGLIKPGAELQLISSQFSFTEGPAADKMGNVYFTDQPNDAIWKFTTDRQLTKFMEQAGRSNGLYFDKKNNLWSCTELKNDIWCISTKKKIKIFELTYQGHRLNGPNDLWVHPNGGIYLTDPYYQRSWWKRKESEIGDENLYYLPKGKTEVVLVDDQYVKPNGIIGTPDGKLLYVADIGDRKTYRYEIGPDGKLMNRQLFANMGSDGMTIDNQGNIYLTGNGVTIFNSEGKKIEHITVPENWTANVCFGGKNKDQLFITASKSVYMLDMLVKGVQ